MEGTENLACRLEHWAVTHPDRAAIRCGADVVTFRQLDNRAGAIGAGLRDLQVREGERVAVLSGSDPEFVSIVYGIWKAGAIAVLLNPQLPPSDIADQLSRTGVSVVVVNDDDRSKAQLAQKAAAWIGGRVRVVPAIDLDGNPIRSVDLSEDALATIAFTSGTTGIPKGAAHSHAALSAHSRMVAVHYSASDRDVLMSLLPLYLLSIFLAGPVLAIEVGAPCRVLPKYDTATFLRFAKVDRPTIAAAVPVFFYDLIEMPPDDRSEMDLSSFRVVSCGGAPLAPHVRDAFEQQFDLRFVQAYGSTESPGILTTDPITGERHIESVGCPLPHIGIEIEGEDGRVLPAGEIGEVCSRAQETGPYAGMYRPLSSYWGMPDETAAALAHGRLHTGDVGYLDEDGFLYLVDRKKDVIIRGGMNVYPKEIELLLAERSEIAEAAVIGKPHPRYGEVPVAFVRLERDGQLRRLLGEVNAGLPRYKQLEDVVAIDDFPRNSLGKVLKRELAQMLNH